MLPVLHHTHNLNVFAAFLNPVDEFFHPCMLTFLHKSLTDFLFVHLVWILFEVTGFTTAVINFLSFISSILYFRIVIEE